MTERLLGWNRAKWDFTLSSPNSKIYGNMTREDADRLNAELLAVAGILSSYEVVADDDTLPTSWEVIEQPIVEAPVHEDISLPFTPQTDNRKPVEETEYMLEDFIFLLIGMKRRRDLIRSTSKKTFSSKQQLMDSVRGLFSNI